MLSRAPSTAADLAHAVWIDLVTPTDAERGEVEAAARLKLPTKADVEEIESSSRVYVDEGALYLSTPMLAGNDCLRDLLTSVGFVLKPDLLVTLRFAPLPAFEEVSAAYAKVAEPTAGDAFLRLLEQVVDHTADALEHAGAQLEVISHEAFAADRPRREHARMSAELRGALRKLGRMLDGISHLRDSLLGIGRIVAFVHEAGHDAHVTLAPARLAAIRGDIISLNDYQAHLTAKVQFLLDATLGFINIQQNDIVKTLTIVSVVGVPPVLIAGIYGMNFHVMPELNWPLGYPYALVLIVVSGLLPLAWLKWRGWM